MSVAEPGNPKVEAGSATAEGQAKPKRPSGSRNLGKAERAHVVIATWNLAAPRSPTVRRRQEEYIAQVAPDLWIFTESHDLIRTGHANIHSSVGGRDHDEDQKTRWVSITSDHELIPLPVRDPVRTAATRVQRKAEAPFIVFGTVLPWLGSPLRGHAASGGEAFEAALKVQAEDWKVIRHLYPNDEFVLAGDFNQDLADSHFYGSKRNRALLQEVLADAGFAALTGGSADPIRRDSPPRACIDHICLLRESRWQPFELKRWPDLPLPDKALSDHFGVAVTLAEGSNTPVGVASS